MNVLFGVGIVLFTISSADCQDTEGDAYHGLPPIFLIDDYEECKRTGKLFCRTSILLTPSGTNKSHHWKLIEDSIDNRRSYNHNELFHAICVDDVCPETRFHKNKDLHEVLSNCYRKKYENLGLTADITYLNCSNHDNVYKAGTVDLLWIGFLVSYLSYVAYASYWDFQRCSHKMKTGAAPCDYGESFLIPFSVVNNWNKLKRINTSPDFQKLKSIQGIRFYNMLLIIFCHTYSSYVGGYVLNTEYIENIPNNAMRLGVRNLMVFLVQTFFLFSAFLMSYHIFQLMDNTNTINKKFIWLSFLNRYLRLPLSGIFFVSTTFQSVRDIRSLSTVEVMKAALYVPRIIPPVLVMIGFGSTIWIVNMFYGPIKDLYSDLEYQRCQKNWWTSVLFINNHYNQYDMCYFITWYLAADTQLYVLSLVILSIIWMFRRNTVQILVSCVVIGILIPTVISYIYNLDVIYRITPENAKNNKFRSFNFNAIYSSCYANMATYMVGLSFGYAYSKMKNGSIFRNMPCQLLWWIAFMGLPTSVVMVSSYYYSRFTSAVLSGILKPLYAVGIAIGILGMSEGIGGIVKRICEWKPALIMGNFTYSTYVVHYGIVFYRTATAKQPLYVSDFVLLTSFIFDSLLSFFCGFLMHILVEMPALQIQNKFVPQVRKQRTMDPKKEEK